MNLNNKLTPLIEKSEFLKQEEKHNLLKNLDEFSEPEKQTMLKTFQEEQWQLNKILQEYKKDKDDTIKDFHNNISNI